MIHPDIGCAWDGRLDYVYCRLQRLVVFRAYTQILCIIAIIAVLFVYEAEGKSASEIFKEASKSTVIVLNYNEDVKVASFGSGVVLPNGNIATNCHVINDAVRILVYYQGQNYLANKTFNQISTNDICSKKDICILRVKDLKAPPVTLRKNSRLKVGERVYTIGAPEGLELTLSEGIISSLREVEDGRYIQTTAPISSGSSGGGLFDDDGRLVGLVCFSFKEGQNLNFALPVEWIPAISNSTNVDPVPRVFDLKEWVNRRIEVEELIEMKAWYQLEVSALRRVKAQPNSLTEWEFLGIAYRESGQTAKAIKAFEQAYRLDPKRAGSLYELSLTYRESGQQAKAAEVFEKAYRLDPEYASNYYTTAYEYFWSKKQYQRAIELCQEAVRLNPKHLYSWELMGHSYRFSDQKAKAIDVYKHAITIDPKFIEAWLNLGGLYSYIGETQKAMEVYNRIKAIDQLAADQFYKEFLIP